MDEEATTPLGSGGGRWMLLVDPAWSRVDDDEQPPVDAILGGWFVGEDRTTRIFEPNPRYLPAELESPTDTANAPLDDPRIHYRRKAMRAQLVHREGHYPGSRRRADARFSRDCRLRRSYGIRGLPAARRQVRRRHQALGRDLCLSVTTDRLDRSCRRRSPALRGSCQALFFYIWS